jgi:hypothetical protein
VKWVAALSERYDICLSRRAHTPCTPETLVQNFDCACGVISPTKARSYVEIMQVRRGSSIDQCAENGGVLRILGVAHKGLWLDGA